MIWVKFFVDTDVGVGMRTERYEHDSKPIESAGTQFFSLAVRRLD
jgi:hypothetical protein